MDNFKQSLDNGRYSLPRRQCNLPANLSSAYIMKSKSNAFSQKYVMALKKHLNQSPGVSLQPALKLGRQAIAMGLETLDVARIHEEALATLPASGGKDGRVKRAEMFFTEAISPIENTHHAAIKTTARLNQLKEQLARRTVYLAASRRSLEQVVIQRKAVELTLAKSGARSHKLLKESHQLQKHLQHSTRRVLSVQEEKRKKISCKLQDEIAQTLLGINVRLLSLRQEATFNADSLKKNIAGTQRLVDQSVKRINRFARELGRTS